MLNAPPKSSYMRGFHVEAVDGNIGDVEKFLIDGKSRLRYLIIDTSTWIGGKSVIVPASTIETIDSPDQKILLNITRCEVERSPRVDAANLELIENLGWTIF